MPAPRSSPSPRPTLGRSGWEQRYTTRALVDLETELLDVVANRMGGPVGALGGGRIAAAVRNATTLGADQRTAVEQLLGQGNPVEVLVGRAGTGKTFTLATVAAAYQDAGFRVVGVAPSARAARELADGTGLETFTVPRYHRAINGRPLDQRSVVIVDEAAMCGTVDLHSIVTTARRAGAKVILVGDHHQLPEISAGGGFRAAVDLLGGDVCELTVNRRVTEPWEVDALDELRCGHIATAWAAYRAHDRVTVGDDHGDVRALAVADWWAVHSTGGRAFLLAGTRAETTLLNHLARQRAADAGHLQGPAIEVHGRTFQAGDRVLLTRNDANQTSANGARVRVDNGTLATVAAVHPDRTITIRFDNNRSPITLSREYVAAGWVEHGYAMTIHKSQGATCDQAFVVGPAGLYREAAYVAMSRARHGAHLYATTAQAAALTELGHSTGIPLPDEHDDPEHELVARLERSQTKSLATAISPHARQAAQLAAQTLATLEQRLAGVRYGYAALTAAGVEDPTAAIDKHAQAAATRPYLAVGGRVRALDRDNIGIVTAIEDASGTATVTFRSTSGRNASRTLPWPDLKPIDAPKPAPLPHQAQQCLAAHRAELAQLDTAWRAALAAHGLTPTTDAVLQQAIATRVGRVANQLAADPPKWLRWWIGTRPADPAGAAAWDDTITRIATWRDRHHIPTDTAGLGPKPAEPPLCDAWYRELERILDTRAWLAARQTPVEPVEVAPLAGPALVERIEVLDRLLATAPPDCQNLIDGLLAGNADPDTVHAALVDAHRAQTARRAWILANWPHIVEREQLGRLADSDPLGHWPAPVNAAIRHALEQLRRNLEPPPTTENRALTELEALLAAADPDEHLTQLTSELIALRHQLNQIHLTQKTAPTSAHELLAQEADVLTRRVDLAAATLEAERTSARNAELHNDPYADAAAFSR